VRGGAVAGLVVLAGAGLVAVASLPPPKRPPSDGPARRSSDRFGSPVRVGIAPRPPGQALGSIVAVLALALLGVQLLGPGPTGVEVPRVAPFLALLSLGAALGRGIAVRGAGARHEVAAGAARTDPLTGLASRKAMSEALAGDPGATRGPDGVPGAGWSGWTDRVALLLVDLDRFEEINVALGREAGDAVLTEVGARLQAVLRPEQLLARLGGDEFAVLLPGAGREPATRVAQALRDALAEPLSLDGTRLHVQATVGVATCLLPRGEPEDLLRQADLAVARAKAAGTGVAVYDPAVDRLGPHRLLRIDELRSALEHGDLEVYLQPQVALASGAIVGAEALARWRHPHDGVLLPEAFLPLAGQTGLLRPVAAAVLDSALGTCARWWARGHRVPVSVNLSADDLRDGDLTERIAEHLARHGLPPQALQIELTEDVLVADPPAVADLLRRWRAAGVSVAVDDYGTGYSSLAYLRELPLDELKLDRVFVADLHRRSTLTIVEHTVAMAHGLGLRVVAEGIEDDATATALASLGCDVGQGLYFGGAMAPDAFLAHLADEAR
jgi:diguanylate cyclase (GGDEF)-like protein